MLALLAPLLLCGAPLPASAQQPGAPTSLVPAATPPAEPAAGAEALSVRAADHGTYDYKGLITEIGGLSFVYDVKSWPDYAKSNAEDPGSDGEAISRLLAQHSLAFPKRAARVRMFHLPTPAHRTELMIIYGEELPEGSPIPVRAGGVVLDTEAPAAAHTFLEHARADLTITRK